MNKKSLQGQLQHTVETALHMRIVLFLTLLVVLYAFVGWRINTLANAEPNATDISSKQSSTSKPYIDQTIVDKVKQLQDNSVNVQALFDQARQNPFQE